MTKGEYLGSVQKKADKATAAFSKKGILRKALVTGVLCLGTAIICLVGASLSDQAIENDYTRFVEDSSSVKLENLGYKDTYEIWNAKSIGNDVNCLLSGGEIYSHDGLVVMPKGDRTSEILMDSRAYGSLQTGASYINVWDDSIIYRSGDRALIAYDLSSRTSRTLRPNGVGEVFVSEGTIYFVDLGKNRNIYAGDTEGSDILPIIESPVDTFIVLGDTIVYRDFENVLHSYSTVNASDVVLGRGVERFFLASGGLVIESGDKIYQADSLGRNPQEIYASDNDSMRLAGAYGQMVFIQEDSKLYALKGEEHREIIGDEYALYASLCVDGDTLKLVAYQDNAGSSAKLLFKEIALS